MQNRDVWTEAREVILNASPDNSKALDRIQSAIIVLALDKSQPVTREDISRAIWAGDGQSRFFDKHQLIVFDNGRSGFNGEHSSMDGTPTSRLNDWMLRSLVAQKIELGNPKPTPDSSLPAVNEITFKLDQKSQQSVETAKQAFNQELSKHKINVLQYNGYGKDL